MSSHSHQDFVTVNVGYGGRPPPSLVTKTDTKKDSENKEEKEKSIKYTKGDLAKTIIQARTSKKMTQKALAQLVNMKPNEINQIEAGNAVYNPGQINKLQRALGCNLPRPK